MNENPEPESVQALEPELVHHQPVRNTTELTFDSFRAHHNLSDLLGNAAIRETAANDSIAEFGD